MTARTLVLLRHAKADRPAGLADVDRPLTDRGHADASAAGAWLTSKGYVPDLVICSPAKRTRQTWHGVALSLPSAPSVRYEKRVYSGRAQDLLSLVTGAEDDIGTVLLIGHNPSVSLFSTLLDPAGGAGDSDGLRTCGLAVHQLPGAWHECGTIPAPLTTTHTARA
jgi:phosphohistidine phosphatase